MLKSQRPKKKWKEEKKRYGTEIATEEVIMRQKSVGTEIHPTNVCGDYSQNMRRLHFHNNSIKQTIQCCLFWFFYFIHTHHHLHKGLLLLKRKKKEDKTINDQWGTKDCAFVSNFIPLQLFKAQRKVNVYFVLFFWERACQIQKQISLLTQLSWTVWIRSH